MLSRARSIIFACERKNKKSEQNARFELHAHTREIIERWTKLLS